MADSPHSPNRRVSKKQGRKSSRSSTESLHIRANGGEYKAGRILRNREHAKRSRMKKKRDGEAIEAATCQLRSRLEEVLRLARAEHISVEALEECVETSTALVRSVEDRVPTVGASRKRCKVSDETLRQRADAGDSKAQRQLRNRLSARRHRVKELHAEAEREYAYDVAKAQNVAVDSLISAANAGMDLPPYPATTSPPATCPAVGTKRSRPVSRSSPSTSPLSPPSLPLSLSLPLPLSLSPPMKRVLLSTGSTSTAASTSASASASASSPSVHASRQQPQPTRFTILPAPAALSLVSPEMAGLLLASGSGVSSLASAAGPFAQVTRWPEVSSSQSTLACLPALPAVPPALPAPTSAAAPLPALPI